MPLFFWNKLIYMICFSCLPPSCHMKFAEAWQNQIITCAPSEDSDQSWNPTCLISLRCSLCGQLRTQGGFQDWSESTLGAQVILLFLSSSGPFACRYVNNERWKQICLVGWQEKISKSLKGKLNWWDESNFESGDIRIWFFHRPEQS